MRKSLTAPFCVEELEFHSLRARLQGIMSSNEDTYIQSATYYRLTGRKGSWVYYSNNSLLVMSKHPHKDDTLMIFPEIGQDPDYTLTAELLQVIDRTKTEVLLSRYTDKGYEKLLYGLPLLKNNNVRAIEKVSEEILDWKYPVRILDTHKVSELVGGAFRKIRNKYIRAGEGIDIIPIVRGDHLRLMRSALKFWEGNMILDNKETEGMSEFYIELFKLIQGGGDLVEGLCFVKEGRPIGFTAWDVTQNEVANLFVNLADTTITGSSDYQLISTCRHLRKIGIKFLNAGGSESPKLDEFKEKYLPAISVNIFTFKVT